MENRNTNDCIQILNERTKWFFRKNNIAKKIQCFDTIKNAGTPNTIYSIINFLKSDNGLMREKAAEVILHLFSKLKSQNDDTDSLKHFRIEKNDLDFYKVAFDENSYVQLLGIASLNSSGYVREQAIKALATLKNAAGLKFILYRLNDWVVAVRTAAMDAIPSFLDIVYVDEL